MIAVSLCRYIIASLCTNLLISVPVLAQGPPPPPPPPLAVLETQDGPQFIVDLGDIGSLTAPEPDGFDDFAVSFDILSTGDAEVHIYDGRTQQVINVLTSNLDPKDPGYGSVLAGGLDIIGDKVPDLVIGTFGSGQIDIVDLETIRGTPTVQTVSAPAGSAGWYGYNIALVGDVRGLADPLYLDGKSEILVTAINITSTDPPLVYAIDANDGALPDSVWHTFEAQDPNQGGNEYFFWFGWSIATFGDVWPPPSDPNDDEYPEVVIGDPYYPHVPGGGGGPDDTEAGIYIVYTFDEAMGEFVVLQDAAAGLPLQVFRAPARDLGWGRFLSAVGDADDDPDLDGDSWDFAVGHSTSPGNQNDELHFHGRHTSDGSANDLEVWGPGPVLWAESSSAHWGRAPQIAATGDVNGDGHDDYILAEVGCFGDNSSAHGAFRVYSGENVATPSLLFEKKRHDGNRLWGAQTEGSIALAWVERNFVAALGDVSGEGYRDFAIASGYLENDPGGMCTSVDPDTTLVMLFEPDPGMVAEPPPPPLPLYHPGLSGNIVAPIGRGVVLRVYNLIPGDIVFVFESDNLQTPNPLGCSGEPHVVYATTGNPNTPQHGPYVVNQYGEVAIRLSIEHDPSLIGTHRYYQIIADPNPGPPYMVCRLSNARRVDFIDLSDPRWLYPGVEWER